MQRFDPLVHLALFTPDHAKSKIATPQGEVMPGKLQRYVHNENIARYQKLIAESERDPSRDELRHQTLQRLLADELAKEKRPRRGKTLASLLPTLLLSFAIALA